MIYVTIPQTLGLIFLLSLVLVINGNNHDRLYDFASYESNLDIFGNSQILENIELNILSEWHINIIEIFSYTFLSKSII